MSEARDFTDKRLSEIEDKIQGIFDNNKSKVQSAWNKYMNKAAKKVQPYQQAYDDALERGDEDEIREAKRELQNEERRQTVMNEQYREMVDGTTSKIADVNILAAAFVGTQLADVFIRNYNEVGTETIISWERFADEIKYPEKNIVEFNLIDRNVMKMMEENQEIKLPQRKLDVEKDKNWNTKQINSQVYQGIQRGESVKDIAKRLDNVYENNEAAAERYARTACTYVENTGRIMGMKELEELGFIVMKVWETAGDDRVRPSHEDTEGEMQPLNEEFSNGCMYPGEGPADEVWNCRCTLGWETIGLRTPDGIIDFDW